MPHNFEDACLSLVTAMHCNGDNRREKELTEPSFLPIGSSRKTPDHSPGPEQMMMKEEKKDEDKKRKRKIRRRKMRKRRGGGGGK